jgi:hypothetical protein
VPLKDQIAHIIINEPRSTLDVVDLWKIDDLHMMMHFANFLNDKKKIQRFNFYQSMELLKKIKKRMELEKQEELRELGFRDDYKKWHAENLAKRKLAEEIE